MSTLIVVKIGSSLVANADSLRLRHAFIHGLFADIASLKAQGHGVVLVSSGAVALGSRVLDAAADTLADKQAAAACGQPLLMQAFRAIGLEFGLDVAQVLLTYDDLADPTRLGNCRATLDRLLQQGVLPVINENDSVATEELTVGDNDRLAAKVAVTADAQQLVILTSVDGLYDRKPDEPGAALIEQVTDVSAYLDATDGVSSLGRGGMRTKLDAALIAQSAGIETVIARGILEAPISSLKAGRLATRILLK